MTSAIMRSERPVLFSPRLRHGLRRLGLRALGSVQLAAGLALALALVTYDALRSCRQCRLRRRDLECARQRRRLDCGLAAARLRRGGRGRGRRPDRLGMPRTSS